MKARTVHPQPCPFHLSNHSPMHFYPNHLPDPENPTIS